MKDSLFWLPRELSKSVTLCRCLRKAHFACLADNLTGMQWEQLALLFIDQDQHLAQNAKGQFFCRNSFRVEVYARSNERAATESMIPVLQCPILKRKTTTYQGRDTFTWHMLLVAKDVILMKKICSCPFNGIFHLFCPINKREFPSLPCVIQYRLHQLILNCCGRWVKLWYLHGLSCCKHLLTKYLLASNIVMLKNMSGANHNLF